jgi:RNA polymerase sigma factor for flagellar operon FliA
MKSKPSLCDPTSQQLIKQHAPLVEKIARRMVKTLAANVDCDDLIQDGMMGLMDAILRNSQTAACAEFESYVAQRARGAMIDGLRINDPGSRQVRRTMRRIEQVMQQLGHQLGRAPLESEVATTLGLQIADYQQILQDAHGYALISIEDLDDENNLENYLNQCADSSADPLVILERAALRQAIASAIEALPKQEKMLLSLYYEDGLRMHEIGKTMALSESRISQLHTQAIAQLRTSFLGSDPTTASLVKPRRKPRQYN